MLCSAELGPILKSEALGRACLWQVWVHPGSQILTLWRLLPPRLCLSPASQRTSHLLPPQLMRGVLSLFPTHSHPSLDVDLCPAEPRDKD